MSKLKEKLANQLEIQDADFEVIRDEKVTILPPPPSNNVVDVVPSFAISLIEAKERVKMLRLYVKEMMIQGEDYGLIPGCKKPTLYKPGAEKLCDIFGFSKHVTVTNRIEDWDKGLFAYEVKVTLINKRTGHIEAEGVGSCNSRERRYKNQTGYDLVNTILKMAKKRALIDGILSSTRSSGLFTQDLEDDTGLFQEKKIPVTEEQLKHIYDLASEVKLTPDNAKKLLWGKYQLEESKLLSFEQAKDLIKHLSAMK